MRDMCPFFGVHEPPIMRGGSDNKEKTRIKNGSSGSRKPFGHPGGRMATAGFAFGWGATESE